LFRFTADSPWVLNDNRAVRPRNRITAGSLNAKMVAALPPELIRDASILDLGSCIGAAGKWCLSNGAAAYVGVEAQREYHAIARSLLVDPRAELVCRDLVEFLESDSRRFDVIVMAGILYGFIDPFWILRLAARHSDCLVIDSNYPNYQRGDDDVFLEFMQEQYMVLPGEGANHAAGWGTRISPRGLDLVMANLGFAAQPMQVPEVADCEDAYNTPVKNSLGLVKFPFRFVRRYRRAPARTLSVAEQVAAGAVSKIVPPFDPNRAYAR
jgi:hypothetical protein